MSWEDSKEVHWIGTEGGRESGTGNYGRPGVSGPLSAVRALAFIVN